MISMVPPYQTFLDGENMGIFWEYVKWILFLVAPIVMIWVAIELVGRFTKVVKGTVHDEEIRRRRTYDDDDDYYY